MKPSDWAAPAPAAAWSFGSARRAGVLASGALTLAGRASAMLTPHEQFQIMSSPAGARVQLSTGENCISPCTLELPRATGFQVRVSLPGFAIKTVTVASRTSVGGAIGFLGNGVISGVVGAGEDLESGAMRSLSPNPLSVRLDPLPAQNRGEDSTAGISRAPAEQRQFDDISDQLKLLLPLPHSEPARVSERAKS